MAVRSAPRRARATVVTPVTTTTPTAMLAIATSNRVRSLRFTRSGARRLEPVPDPAPRGDDARVADLLAHLRDVHVDGALVAVPAVAPHRVEDLLTAHREARALGE